jgi:hypothetical protein
VQRRDVLRSATAILGGASLAGCLDAFESESAWRDLVIDRPDEIYVPSKADGMLVWDRAGAEGYSLALSTTRPHRFWTVSGRETNQIAMREAHSAHLMVSAWEPDSRRLIPAEVLLSIERGREHVLDRTLWPMLSQRMGVHYGDNVALPEPGRYRATARVVPLTVASLGGFEGGSEPATLEFEFDYDPAEIEGLDLTILEESRRGRPGAVEPMVHDHGHDDHGNHGDHGGAHDGHPPIPTAPPPEAFPDVIDDREAGDYRLVVATADREGGRYLIVSPRTRYNGFPLPFASLSVGIDRGSGTERTALREATHPEWGLHYGAPVDSLSGADLAVRVEAPPQIARHEGYETAFFDLPEFSPRAPR